MCVCVCLWVCVSFFRSFSSCVSELSHITHYFNTLNYSNSWVRDYVTLWRYHNRCALLFFLLICRFILLLFLCEYVDLFCFVLLFFREYEYLRGERSPHNHLNISWIAKFAIYFWELWIECLFGKTCNQYCIKINDFGHRFLFKSVTDERGSSIWWCMPNFRLWSLMHFVVVSRYFHYCEISRSVVYYNGASLFQYSISAKLQIHCWFMTFHVVYYGFNVCSIIITAIARNRLLYRVKHCVHFDASNQSLSIAFWP